MRGVSRVLRSPVLQAFACSEGVQLDADMYVIVHRAVPCSLPKTSESISLVGSYFFYDQMGAPVVAWGIIDLIPTPAPLQGCTLAQHINIDKLNENKRSWRRSHSHRDWNVVNARRPRVNL